MFILALWDVFIWKKPWDVTMILTYVIATPINLYHLKCEVSLLLLLLLFVPRMVRR